MSLKTLAVKAFGHNPISKIILLLFKRRVSFNHLTIRIISLLLKQRIPFHGITIDVADKVILPFTKSLLYYGIYEDTEINFVKKYLNENDDVLELGSSIGVMGSIISQIQKTGKYISVEADPALIQANIKNLGINRKTAYVLINKAVDYFNKTVEFAASKSSLSGKVERNYPNNSTITVETVTLSELCDTYNLDRFTLISDIEGSEITFILDDKNALAKCEKIIIELHDTKYNNTVYSIQNMVDLIVNNGFKILDQKAAVFVFQRNNSQFDYS